MLHCYYMNVNCGCSFEQSQAFYKDLPEERKQRIDRMKNPALAKKKILTWAFLQDVLHEETGIVPSEQRFVYNAAGRPALLLPENRIQGIDFNLSDSGDYAVLAVGDCQVGIDIEYKKKNCLAVAKRCFCREEYEDIMAMAEASEQERRFLQYWTMKEAYVKYEGSGLGIALNSFRVIWDSDKEAHIIRNVGEETEIAYGQNLFLDEKYCVSVYSRGKIQNIIHMVQRKIWEQ